MSSYALPQAAPAGATYAPRTWLLLLVSMCAVQHLGASSKGRASIKQCATPASGTRGGLHEERRQHKHTNTQVERGVGGWCPHTGRGGREEVRPDPLLSCSGPAQSPRVQATQRAPGRTHLPSWRRAPAGLSTAACRQLGPRQGQPGSQQPDEVGRGGGALLLLSALHRQLLQVVGEDLWQADSRGGCVGGGGWGWIRAKACVGQMRGWVWASRCMGGCGLAEELALLAVAAAGRGCCCCCCAQRRVPGPPPGQITAA